MGEQTSTEVPGLGVDSAQQIIAEVGAQASTFGSAAELTSWVGTCPGKEESAEQSPVIAPIDQDDWARNLGYLEASPPELVALYGLNRHAKGRVACGG